MADFLTEVSSVHKKAANKPEDLLIQVSSRPTKQDVAIPHDGDLWAGEPESQSVFNINTPKEALDLLKSRPTINCLVQVLGQLQSKDGFTGDFNLHSPGPLSAQIISSIIGSIIPTFWSTVDSKTKSLILACLSNVAGCSALITRMRFVCDSMSESKASSNSTHELGDLLSVANMLFNKDDFAFGIWASLSPMPPKGYAKATMAFKEFVTFIASGKVVSTIAQAEDIIRAQGTFVKASWLANGAHYAAWLGRNVADIATRTEGGRQRISGTSGCAAQILTKAFGLGYHIPLVRGLFVSLNQHVAKSLDGAKYLSGIAAQMPAFAKRYLLETTLQWLSTLATATSHHHVQELQRQELEAAAFGAMLKFLTDVDTSFQLELIKFITNPVLSSSVLVSVRRACVAVLAELGSEELQPILETSMGTFGDSLFINHAPILQQESLVQILLLVAGYLHRGNPMAVLLTARSSKHMQGVSNRLGSSNHKARWLGMVAGTAVSSLVDKDGSKMNFGVEEMHTDNAKWYMELVKVNDDIGSLSDFEQLRQSRSTIPKQRKEPVQKLRNGKLPIIQGKQTFGPVRPPVTFQTEVIGDRVTEILDDDDNEDDVGLKPYSKPDSDPEDSDEDATLVNRHKPKAPVYVRDLMRMLKDDKSPDRFQMGIRNAATLIRRKANFGGEVTDHAEELSMILCDLQDPFETEQFDELKLQGLIAVLLSDVKTIGPWLSTQAFIGDYSLSQRCIMLSALGLGGRELAGFKNEDDLNPAPPENATNFPSKRLPGRLHAIYNPADHSLKRLETASKDIERQLIQPIALSAADESTSHLSSVKVRTFSSRMDVERTKRKPAPNQLAKIFGSSFFFPLVSRYQAEIAAYGQRKVFSSAAFVLVTFLKTLALLLHASGPATLDLAEITTAFWELLLFLRVQAVADISIMEALLFSLLTVLEVNSDHKYRVAQENPKLLIETQQWVETVFERMESMPTEDSGDESRVKTLAAGVLVRLREVIESYQDIFQGGSSR